MTIDVHLSVEAGAPWELLCRCPSIARARRARADALAIDVTALVLEEDVRGERHELSPEDAAFLADKGGPVLLPRDVERVHGRGVTSILGTVRASFLGWLAGVAARTGASLLVTYSHERGDHLYELARWWFGSGEELDLADFDGGVEPIWHCAVGRRAASEPAARVELRPLAAPAFRV